MTDTLDILEASLIGCDVGQVNDPTAIVLLQRYRREKFIATDERGEQDRIEQALQRGGRSVPFQPHWTVAERWYAVSWLDRIPLGTRYPAVIDQIAELAEDPQLRIGETKPVVVVDATGVGRAITDLLKARGLEVYPVVFTGGQTVSHEGGYHMVPSKDLVSIVQLLLQSGRLRIAPTLPLAEALAEELKDFRVVMSEQTGHLSFAAGRGSDDLVMALAVACWYGERYKPVTAEMYGSFGGQR